MTKISIDVNRMDGNTFDVLSRAILEAVFRMDEVSQQIEVITARKADGPEAIGGKVVLVETWDTGQERVELDWRVTGLEYNGKNERDRELIFRDAIVSRVYTQLVAHIGLLKQRLASLDRLCIMACFARLPREKFSYERVSTTRRDVRLFQRFEPGSKKVTMVYMLPRGIRLLLDERENHRLVLREPEDFVRVANVANEDFFVLANELT